MIGPEFQAAITAKNQRRKKLVSQPLAVSERMKRLNGDWPMEVEAGNVETEGSKMQFLRVKRPCQQFNAGADCLVSTLPSGGWTLTRWG